MFAPAKAAAAVAQFVRTKRHAWRLRVVASIKEITLKFFRAFGLVLMTQKSYRDMSYRRCALLKAAKEVAERSDGPSVRAVECIVFSKDRPMQLHALLASYCEKVSGPALVHVLYLASNDRYERAYHDVMRVFDGRPVQFIRQTKFRDDLIGMLRRMRSSKVFFLVDDILFLENVDLADFAAVDPSVIIASLRLGANLKKCYTLQRTQPLPPFIKRPVGKEKILWRWDDGRYDWAYPASVDGHLFATAEILLITEVTSFNSPNTFEDALTSFSTCFQDRLGACYPKSVIVNIPWNKVQSDNKNIHGRIHQEYLLEKWELGYQIDYRRFYGYVNQSAHEELDLLLVFRESERTCITSP